MQQHLRSLRCLKKDFPDLYSTRAAIVPVNRVAIKRRRIFKKCIHPHIQYYNSCLAVMKHECIFRQMEGCFLEISHFTFRGLCDIWTRPLVFADESYSKFLHRISDVVSVTAYGASLFGTGRIENLLKLFATLGLWEILHRLNFSWISPYFAVANNITNVFNLLLLTKLHLERFISRSTWDSLKSIF